MANVTKSKNKSKGNDKAGGKASTAMTRSGASTAESREARELEQRAIQAAVAKGFAAYAEDEDVARVEDAGVVEKESLEGVPFLILNVTARDGDYKKDGKSSRYISVTCMLEDDSVVVFNDGSTGIMRMLDGLDISPDKPLLVPGGLRASRYTYEDEDGNQSPACTWYLTSRAPKAKAGQQPPQDRRNGVSARA